MDSGNWILYRNKKSVGPLTLDQLRHILRTGQVDGSAPVRRFEDENWICLSQVLGVLPPPLVPATSGVKQSKASNSFVKTFAIAVSCGVVLVAVYWALDMLTIVRATNSLVSEGTLAFKPTEAYEVPLKIREQREAFVVNQAQAAKYIARLQLIEKLALAEIEYNKCELSSDTWKSLEEGFALIKSGAFETHDPNMPELLEADTVRHLIDEYLASYKKSTMERAEAFIAKPMLDLRAYPRTLAARSATIANRRCKKPM